MFSVKNAVQEIEDTELSLFGTPLPEITRREGAGITLIPTEWINPTTGKTWYRVGLNAAWKALYEAGAASKMGMETLKTVTYVDRKPVYAEIEALKMDTKAGVRYVTIEADGLPHIFTARIQDKLAILSHKGICPAKILWYNGMESLLPILEERYLAGEEFNALPTTSEERGIYGFGIAARMGNWTEAERIIWHWNEAQEKGQPLPLIGGMSILEAAAYLYGQPKSMIVGRYLALFVPDQKLRSQRFITTFLTQQLVNCWLGWAKQAKEQNINLADCRIMKV